MFFFEFFALLEFLNLILFLLRLFSCHILIAFSTLLFNMTADVKKFVLLLSLLVFEHSEVQGPRCIVCD
jgi:hypothetical protein